MNTEFSIVRKSNLKFDKDFLDLMNHISYPMIYMANYAQSTTDNDGLINTHFLGKSLSLASRMEELLDHYNAKNNQKWKPYRETIACIKFFSGISYTTLHLKSTSPQYRLLSGIQVFLSDTEQVIDTFSSALNSCYQDLVKISTKNGIKKQTEIDTDFSESMSFPEGRLESNIKKQKIEDPEKVIVGLATSYLNLASECDLLKKIKKDEGRNYEELIPEVLSENKIRILENKFHNLQSLYDTYISDTDIEDLDSDLRLIRGHASIVYHLMEAATNLIHYYERHMMNLTGSHKKKLIKPLGSNKVLSILVDYFINYSDQFLSAGVTLCRDVIKKYAEEVSIEVKVPGYRGFHVRPSTLVAKIVAHYGSDVYLVMGDEKYDASLPMELFRVNEKINAEKRRNLAQNICSLESVTNPECLDDYQKGVKEIFHELLEENKIINYATEFALPDLHSIVEETLGEFANRVIAFLLAQGKIDLKTDLKVTFQGDKRVLADLEILANCGYGEDCYGNNVVLPEELSYIRR